MSFETVLRDLRELQPFELDDLIEISKQLDSTKTKKYIRKVWLSCQVANSLGFGVSIVDELLHKDDLLAFASDLPDFYSIRVKHGKDSYCFQVDSGASWDQVQLDACERVLNYTGVRIEAPQLLFWNEPIENFEAERISELHGAALNDNDRILTFEVIDTSLSHNDLMFCDVLWSFTQITAQMRATDTVCDLLEEAQRLIEAKAGLTLSVSDAKNCVFPKHSSTAVEPSTLLSDLQPDFDPREQEGFRKIALIVNEEKSRPRRQSRHTGPELKDGYHVHILWDMCQLDFKVSVEATSIEVLKKAKNIIQQKHDHDVSIEDAWDNLFFKGDRIDPTGGLKFLPGVKINDSKKPIHLVVDLNSHALEPKSPHHKINELDSKVQTQFMEEWRERRRSCPTFSCHVFWKKHYTQVAVPVMSTVEDVMKAALEQLESTRSEELDLEDAWDLLTFQGHAIESPTMALTALPGFDNSMELGEDLHFVVVDPNHTPYVKQEFCFFCSLWWKGDEEKEEEFLVCKLPADSTCYDVLLKLAITRQDFDIETDGLGNLWLNHDTLILNPTTQKLRDLPGARLYNVGDSCIEEDSSLHFLIDVKKTTHVQRRQFRNSTEEPELSSSWQGETMGELADTNSVTEDPMNDTGDFSIGGTDASKSDANTEDKMSLKDFYQSPDTSRIYQEDDQKESSETSPRTQEMSNASFVDVLCIDFAESGEKIYIGTPNGTEMTQASPQTKRSPSSSTLQKNGSWKGGIILKFQENAQKNDYFTQMQLADPEPAQTSI